MHDLESIINYEMNELEAKAFKLSLLWEILAIKEFPNYNHVRLRQKGDPRKSILFRYCYKLVRETKGLVEDPEYRLYILAQLHVLKNISSEALIDPSCLVGKKAWRRWKLWKNKYDKNMEGYRKTVSDVQPIAAQSKMATALRKTKVFLDKKFNDNPTYEDIDQSLKDHSMVKWVTLQRVTPYYVLLSPWVSKSLDGESWENVFLFDLEVYKPSLNNEIEVYFNEVFTKEFV